MSNAGINKNSGTFYIKNANGETYIPFMQNNPAPTLLISTPSNNITLIKKELEVYDDFVQLASAWLTSNGFADWQSIQWAQPSIQGLRTPLLLIDFYDSNRYGWTSTNYIWEKTSNEGFMIISWRKEIYLSFTFWKDRALMSNPTTDLSQYSTAYDVANLFLAYLQGANARNSLASLGYWTLVEPKLYNAQGEDDSGKDTRFPVIRIKFVIKEQISLEDSANFITKEEQEEAFKNRTTIGLYPITSTD